MSTSLSNQYVDSAFGDLLQVSNSGSGIDATLRAVADGEGTDTILQLSTTAVNINGTFQISGNTFARSGAHSLTLTTTATTNVTLPTTGTLATLAGTESFTNKTITAPVFSGSVTGTYTLAGTPTITSPTITSPTISSPSISGTLTQTGMFANTSLRVADTNASHALVIAPGSDLTSDRTLTVTTGDAARTLTLTGNLSVTGAATISTTPITQVAVTTFTSSGTYTPASGMVYAIIECVGGGGGGGGMSNAAAGAGNSAGGGGAGAYARKRVTAAQVGASQTVTIGAGGAAGANTSGNGGNGGNTSVGALCVANGGTGGTGGQGGAGGAGGTGGTGDYTAYGNAGGGGVNNSIITVYCTGGEGGAGYFGSGAGTQRATASTAGANAPNNNTGAGGNGGISFAAGGAVVGGLGASGVVIITEFIAV